MIVDHDQRRAGIAAITTDLVAREGIEAATIRRIAAQAGCSTTAITGYFADKQDLLLWTFRLLAEDGERRFEDALAAGLDDGIDALMTLVPWCPANVRRWKAYLAFWDRAARDPEMAGMLARSTRVGLSGLRRLLGGSGPALDRAAALLNAMIQGFALQMLVDARGWTEARVRAELSDALRMARLRLRS